MPRSTVEVLEDGHYWAFAGRRRQVSDFGEPVAHLEDLERCRATDLQVALRRCRDRQLFGSELFVSDGPSVDADVEDGPVGSVSFVLIGDRLSMRLHYLTSTYIDDDEVVARTERALAPLLARHRLWLAGAANDGSQRTEPWVVDVEIGFHTRDRILADLVRIAVDAIALLEAVMNGRFGREQVADLVRSGHVDVLIGQPEGQWLEAKRQHYDLSSAAGKIALARSVARFANAEEGGIVVIGLETKGAAGQDIVSKVRPMPHDARVARRYQQVLGHRLYPPPDALRIEAVNLAAGDVVLIDVPPQPEDLKPFLVHGAVIDSKTEDAFISIVRRRGDSSIPITASMIHATLAAGRALLRRGQLPSEGTEPIDDRQHPSTDVSH